MTRRAIGFGKLTCELDVCVPSAGAHMCADDATAQPPLARAVRPDDIDIDASTSVRRVSVRPPAAPKRTQ